MSAKETQVHGTCVALGSKAALLRGSPGAGKSDLALRFIDMYGGRADDDSAALVADDQTCLSIRGGDLIASAPVAITGQLEVRGVGIVEVSTRAEAALKLLVDLVDSGQPERLPSEPMPLATILGLTVPVIKLAPFEASAPVKLKLAIDRAP